jgi:integrase
MPRPKTIIPKLTRHKAKARGVVRLNGKDHYLGPWPAGAKLPPPDVRAAYDRLIAEWLAAQRGAVEPGAVGPALGPTVAEVLLAFWRYAERHYRHPDGAPTTEPGEIKHALRPVRELYGLTPAAEFGPRTLAAVREDMIRRGWCRTLVNRRVERVKRCFRWAASQELVPVSVDQALRTLAGLQAGRTEAREAAPVGPVPVGHYEATLPFLPRVPRAMAELQRWTGMRPGEVCRLKLAEIDHSGPVWLYRPGRHKTRHRGKTRVVPIGPRGQAVLLAFLAGRTPPPCGAGAFDLATPAGRLAAAVVFDGHARPIDAALLRDLSRPVVLFGGSVVDPDAFIFDAARDRAERFAAWRRARKSKVPPSQRDRRKAAPAKVPGRGFRPHAYTNAVGKACRAAGVPHWHPNQLRHLRGTEVRRGFGLEAAQVVLGHARADVTQVYAERDLALALDVADRTG